MPTTDLMLRGGHVIDPSQGLDAPRDILVRDGLVGELRGRGSPAPAGVDEVDVTGAIVTPGLVDLHGHWYDGSAYGIDPAVSLKSGVTVAVDAGTAGFVNFASFRRQTIDPAPLRMAAFVNVAALGIPTPLSGELERLVHARPIETVDTIRANADVAVGVKVRLSACGDTNAPEALEKALEASRAAERPLMVDIGGPSDFMPEALGHLGPGDILTHCFTGAGATIVDAAGRVRREALDARARGVLFDIGHGCGSFSWRSARAAIGHGFAPDSLSTDLHRYSITGPAGDLLTVMAKFLHLGLSLPEVVERVTIRPAAAISLADAPSLRPGSRADIAVFRVVDTEVKMADSMGEVETVRRRLEPVVTLVGGRAINPDSVSVTLRPYVEADRGYTCGASID